MNAITHRSAFGAAANQNPFRNMEIAREALFDSLHDSKPVYNERAVFNMCMERESKKPQGWLSRILSKLGA